MVEMQNKDNARGFVFKDNIVDNVPVPFAYIDADNCFVYCSRLFRSWLQKSPEDIRGSSLKKVLDQNIYDNVQRFLPTVFEGKSGVFAVDIIDQSEQKRRVQVIITPDFDPDNVFQGFYITGHDITTFENARERAEIFIRALEASNIGVAIADAKIEGMPMTYINSAFSKITGYNYYDDYEHDFSLLEGPKTDKETSARFHRAIKEEEPVTVEVLHYKSDGTTFWSRFSALPVKNDQGELTAYVGIMNDITREKCYADMEHQRQKMESLGRVAGGVAHEINNALQPVLLLSDVLKEQLPEESKEKGYVDMIRENAGFASDIVEGILAFSRLEEAREMSVFNAPSILDLAVTFASELIPSSVTIKKEGFGKQGISNNAHSILVDKTGFMQITTNLFNNACHAIDDKGCITVKLQDSCLSEDAAGNLGIKKGDYVLITVSDDGCGMDDATIKSIFEPFFTTKDIGEGTGLGLSTIYGIVENWDGTIRVESHLGEGTTFLIYIPIHQLQKGE